MSQEEDIRERLVNACRSIHQMGLAQTGEGNISAKIDDRSYFITPTFNDYKTIIPDDLSMLSMDGLQFGGGRPPSSEYRLHQAIYHAFPKVGAVCHTHSPYASMLSVAGRSIPVIFEEMLIFVGGEIGCAPYAQANTDEIADAAVSALGVVNATLLANHGVLVVGRDLPSALKAAELTEKMAKVYWGAAQLGEINEIPVDKRRMFLEKFERDFSIH